MDCGLWVALLFVMTHALLLNSDHPTMRDYKHQPLDLSLPKPVCSTQLNLTEAPLPRMMKQRVFLYVTTAVRAAHRRPTLPGGKFVDPLLYDDLKELLCRTLSTPTSATNCVNHFIWTRDSLHMDDIILGTTRLIHRMLACTEDREL